MPSRQENLDVNNPQVDGSLHVSTTGQMSFSVSLESEGFKTLLRLLATPMFQLGFRKAPSPHLPRLGLWSLDNMTLLCHGTAGGGRNSFVFSVDASLSSGANDELTPAILKLNRSPFEVTEETSQNHTQCLSATFSPYMP
jgi:hypothetical protein